MLRVRSWTAAFALVVSALPVCGQGASFFEAKRSFQSAVKDADVAVRRAAYTTFAESARPETVATLLTEILEQYRRLDGARTRFVEMGRRAETLKIDFRMAEARQRAGQASAESVAALQKELASVQGQLAGASAAIDTEESVSLAARRSVGSAFDACSEPHRIIAARECVRAFDRTKEIEEKAEILQALVFVKRDEIHDLVALQFKKGLPVIRVAVLSAYETRGGKSALEPALLGVADPSWPVQAAAVRVLRKIGGKDAARALVQLLPQKGRLSSDAQSALEAMSGTSFHDNEHLWMEWLDKNGHTLKEPTDDRNAGPGPSPVVDGRRGGSGKKPGEAKGTGFYGIDTKSKHIIYVIDFSGSMNAPLSATDGTQPDSAYDNPKIGGPRKVDGCATELLKSIDALPSDGTFTVVLFHTTVKVWSPTMKKADPTNKKAIRDWVLTQPPAGSTNFFGGIEEAFKLVGRGAFDKHYGTVADTIIVLSDGSPTEGRIQDTAQILREVRQWNELSRIAVHCVGLGRGINAQLLSSLASQNDGDFVHVF